MDKSDGKSPAARVTHQSEPDFSRRSFVAGTGGVLAGTAAMALGGFAIGAASTPAIAQPASKAKIVAKYGHDSGPGSGLQYFGEYFAGRVAQLTDGEVEVQIFPSSQLGSTTEMTQAVKQGTLEFALPTGVLAGSVITPELGVFGLPYLIKSWQQATRVEYSSAGELLRDRATQKGVRILAFAPNALRNLYYNMRGDKPVMKVEDVEGMKIRVIESPIDVGAWAACGALPTPIAFNEVFNAMQQKVVDGVDNAFNSAASIHLDEVTNAVTLTNHRYEVNLFITNDAWFKRQTKRVQDAMQTAAREASIYQQGFVMWDDIRIPKLWAAQKKIRTVVPDLSGFVKKMTSIYPKFEEKFGKEIMQLVEKV
jgi:TRAP-type transport system periplasmic protein